MNDKTEQALTDALRRAFSLGKTYWQQAHSDFISQHVKADATRAKFQELCERTEDTIDTLRAQLAEAQKDAEREKCAGIVNELRMECARRNMPESATMLWHAEDAIRAGGATEAGS